MLREEEETKEQILEWLQFVAGKRAQNDVSDVFFICTFCEESRPDIETAKVELQAFLEWLQSVIHERFPSISMPQTEPVRFHN